MSESTEIANAIYFLASTIKSAVAFASFIAFLIWIGTVLFSGSEKKAEKSKLN